jgi:hypothetical protein
VTRETVEWDPVNMIDNLVSIKDNLLTSTATVNFSRRSSLHVVSQSLNATLMVYNYLTMIKGSSDEKEL